MLRFSEAYLAHLLASQYIILILCSGCRFLAFQIKTARVAKSFIDLRTLSAERICFLCCFLKDFDTGCQSMYRII